MLQTDVAKGVITQPAPGFSGMLCSFRAEISLKAAQLTANQIVEMLALPAGCTPVDLIIDSDDIDTNAAPTVTIDVGLMSGEFGVNDSGRTCGAEFLSGATVAQAGGGARPTIKGAFRVEPSASDRSIGIKIGTAPATAADGKIGLTLIYRG